MKIERKSIPGSGSSKCKGPEAGADLQSSDGWNTASKQIWCDSRSMSDHKGDGAFYFHRKPMEDLQKSDMVLIPLLRSSL